MAGLPNLINVRGALYGEGGGSTQRHRAVAIVHLVRKSVVEYRNINLIS